MTMKNKIVTLIAAVLICVLVQSYDHYMGIQPISQQTDLSGD
ncbi:MULTISPECIES: hypothetical protein [Acinetobacter]|uniref:Uncharacterized protein n=1 Tax=Acinetobacter courvalinii TaxID=280147 RepID=N9P565_9GAMM|nr:MULTISPECIES: hypothetical protein [Acinetobacter]ENX09300.1 hypothetical protein F898_01101 [Acinetobacter courvalinii]ENX39950.1 hypothetical protein F888_00589 [Acinetobacter courvalinii]GGH36141.1 hypothetical protein GCM10007354_19770 [Acinetobacter courvalinii]